MESDNMIPIKKYKKSFTKKDGTIIEYISVSDLKTIINDFHLELIREFNSNDFTIKGIENKFKKYMKF
jgi:hypothetical protein